MNEENVNWCDLMIYTYYILDISKLKIEIYFFFKFTVSFLLSNILFFSVLEDDVIGGSSLDYNKHYHSMRYIPERTHRIQPSDPYHTELPHTYWKHYNISNFQDDTRPRTQNRIIHIVDEKVQNVRKSFRNMDSRLKDLRQSYRRGDVDLKYLRKSFRNMKLSRNVSFSRNDQYNRSFRFMRDIVSRGYRQNCYFNTCKYFFYLFLQDLCLTGWMVIITDYHQFLKYFHC